MDTGVRWEENKQREVGGKGRKRQVGDREAEKLYREEWRGEGKTNENKVISSFSIPVICLELKLFTKIRDALNLVNSFFLKYT